MEQMRSFGNCAGQDANRAVVLLEHHPNDSRLRITDDGICQTLNSRMGTGGGNVPLILEMGDDEEASDRD